MEMLTKEIESNLPSFYSQEEVEDPTVQVKYFCPWSSWTWYGIEYSPEERNFFGYVIGHEAEMGYFNLDELESVTGPGGLKIERDLHFTPCLLSKIKERG